MAAECAIAVVESTQKALRLHASTLFCSTGTKLPISVKNLRAKASIWACGAMSANDDHRSSYELWNGHVAPLPLLPFLKPGFINQKPAQKHLAKAVPCRAF